MDHLHGRHSTTYNPLLARKVKLLYVLGRSLSFDRTLFDLSLGESFEECIDLVLAKNLAHTWPTELRIE